MNDSEATDGLEMRWYPVSDESGRTRMEARWVLVDAEHVAVVGTAA